jgi:hypothetical protein
MCSSPHEEIRQKLQISRPTYHRHINRIMKEDAEIWDKVHIDSAKYRATKLIQTLDKCVNLCRGIRDDQKNKPEDRIDAAKTMCEALKNLFKSVNEGPTFKPSLSLSHNNNQELNNDNDKKELPN